MHGTTLCAVAYKRDKEVLLVCKPAGAGTGAGGMICEELPPVGSGKLGSWGLVNMSGDSKIFVIEGADCVAVYESGSGSWRQLCKLSAAMVSYASSLYRLPSVILGQCLYILLVPPPEGVERTDFKIAALDYERNEWAEFDVVTPRAFSRIRLVAVQERLLLVGVQEGIIANESRFFIMNVSLSTNPPQCVEVSEMPGGFCAALADDNSSTSVFKFKDVVRGYKDSLFFVTSKGKPVVYSVTKNTWAYVTCVPVLSKMHSDNYGVRSRPQSE